MRIKGVIFDFNGTLFWDTHLHNRAWDIFLDKHEIKLTDTEKNEKIHGKNNKEIMQNLFTEKLTLDHIKKYSIEKENIYQELCLREEMVLAPGATDFLSFLKKHQIPYTIATASDYYNVEFYFKHLQLDNYFEMSKVLYNDGSFKSKPHPGIFQKAMKILNIKPHETLIFEDSISGIKAAENSNARMIIAVNSNNGNYDTEKHQIIRNFSEVDRSFFVS